MSEVVVRLLDVERELPPPDDSEKFRAMVPVVPPVSKSLGGTRGSSFSVPSGSSNGPRSGGWKVSLAIGGYERMLPFSCGGWYASKVSPLAVSATGGPGSVRSKKALRV